MPERTEYPPGTPSWVDLQSSDTAKAKQFYGELFGWTYDDQPIPDTDAVYSMAQKNGKNVYAGKHKRTEIFQVKKFSNWHIGRLS